ncbi:MAG: mannose-1-phosphate guanylyltransferase [Anaerolineae bacterium]|nr:mannose-1-phosphate guanylyltransferase [Anaerolineae bacterium]
MEHYYALIMAGGGGTRLWPMSRRQTPKQFLPLVEDESMFRVSMTRLAPLFTPDRVYVVAGERYAEELMRQAPEIPERNFILEPSARDSGPAAALGVAVIHQRDPQATIAILTADHHIADKAGFRNALAAAHDVAQRDYIVTLGISPTMPSSAFGYIRRGEPLEQARGLQAYHAARFEEKPPREKAIEFLMSGEYSWNSGMFIWRSERALGEFERQQPAYHQHMAQIASTVDTPTYQETLRNTWESFDKKSLDYAVMEHADRIAVIPVDIGWSDVGSWSTLYDVLSKNDNGNCTHGNTQGWIAIDTTNTLVYSGKLVATIGVEDLVVVETDDALFICTRERAQDVKFVVEQLKASNMNDHI